ncbi:MAG: hypothetical protein QGI29_03260 [Pirellulales bacterium]|nr:hypothetical protein [Pirellulales bacterium]
MPSENWKWQTLATTKSPKVAEVVRQNLQDGTALLGEHTWVAPNHPHYDAKVFVAFHPYGTGSLLSEAGSGGTQALARNRLLSMESQFRRSALYGFFQYDRLNKTALFFKEKRRRQAEAHNVTPDGPGGDPCTRIFGEKQPTDLPESSTWWNKQQKDICAIADDAEEGIFQTMVTITHNDSAPEILAAVRRGPGAKPEEHEKIEYLMGRKPRNQHRPVVETHSVEHVLSFQRRVQYMKKEFFRRGKITPLGVFREWWDRTEAQMRAALHGHILGWFQKRDEAKIPVNYSRVPVVPRNPILKGCRPRQRPNAEGVEPLKIYQEDHLYHKYKVGRVNAQMVRPNVSVLKDCM